MPRSDHEEVYPPPADFAKDAHVSSKDEYDRMYRESVDQPETFWLKQADNFFWKSAPDPARVLSYNFDRSKGNIFVRWFDGAKTNICYNAVDRHVEAGLGQKIAFYWEGNEVGDDSVLTFKDLKDRVCRFANVLLSKGIKKGDRVAIYLPMIPELAVAMLACARIGAVHSIVFGGFSASALAGRIVDGSCSLIVTADGVWRGPKMIFLKEIVEEAIELASNEGVTVKSCIVVKHIAGDDPIGKMEPKVDLSKVAGKRPCNALKVEWKERDEWYSELMAKASPECPIEWMDAEDPLFILYTSGSTGKPKGVVHTTAGYMVYAATTFKYVFDAHPADDVFFCTADIGWITGHSYVVYGPLCNGVSGVIFEGLPFYPTHSRYWEVIDKYRVTKFYTAPTALRSLMKFGDEFVTRTERKSLKILGSVGEPINPEAWRWYHSVVGSNRCPIVDTYWQTETGGHVMTPLPGAIATKPGSATVPFFGIVPRLLIPKHDIAENGNGNGNGSTNGNGELSNGDREIIGEGEGHLVFAKPWPGMMRTVFGNHKRFEDTYFNKFLGFYTTGDGAVRDKDGYYWITGRVDDMLNVSGHLLSTAEIEAAMGKHPAVAESAAVAAPDAVRGECVYCFVTPKDGFELTTAICNELKDLVCQCIGPFARPSFVQTAAALPKTRSGKIMRRILRAIAAGTKDFGDVTTLADPSVPDALYAGRAGGKP